MITVILLKICLENRACIFFKPLPCFGEGMKEETEVKILLWEDIRTEALAWQIPVQKKTSGKKPPLLNHKLVYGEPIKKMVPNLE